MQSLQLALNKQKPAEKVVSLPSAPVAAAPKPSSTSPRQASREGHINISAWMSPHYKTSLRLVQAAKGPSSTLQDLLAEALNDLFAKYNVPTIRED